MIDLGFILIGALVGHSASLLGVPTERRPAHDAALGAVAALVSGFLFGAATHAPEGLAELAAAGLGAVAVLLAYHAVDRLDRRPAAPLAGGKRIAPSLVGLGGIAATALGSRNRHQTQD